MEKPDQSAWPLQAFIIGSTVLDAMSSEEVNATYADMEEAGIAKLPYQSCDVIMPPERVLRIQEKSGESHMAPATIGCTIRCRFEGKGFKWLYTRSGTTLDLLPFVLAWDKEHNRDPSPFIDSVLAAAVNTRRLLIVLLATKNIIKETKECKLLKLGIGTKERNRYTTTIKVGRVTEHEGKSGSGFPRRPHLRRGHIRRQHYGPQNELIKQIFIQPVFVNADAGWIAERTAYNISGVIHG